jgi:hypothetical protein
MRRLVTSIRKLSQQQQASHIYRHRELFKKLHLLPYKATSMHEQKQRDNFKHVLQLLDIPHFTFCSDEA